MIKNLPSKDIFTKAENTKEALICFYKELGFDFSEKKILNPTKISLNPADTDDILSAIYRKDGVSGNFLWMNSGPSTSEDVPIGKVKLESDWIEEK